MPLGSVAHRVASADKSVLAQADSAEEILLLKHAGDELEVVGATGVHLVRVLRPVSGDEFVQALLASP